MRRFTLLTLTLLFALTFAPGSRSAHAAPVQLCPEGGIQRRAAAFTPGGIILAPFDSAGLWVYDIDRDRRYPLPETRPCEGNCRLSPDARWVSYFDVASDSFMKMRLDGTQRTTLVAGAADVSWWSADTLLVWTPGHGAYLQAEGSSDREYLNVAGVTSVQPGGRWGMLTEARDDGFYRVLINLETRDMPTIASPRVLLGADVAYFNGAAWSPDGAWLAFVAPGTFDASAGIAGAELFGIRPGEAAPTQWTDLAAQYGAVRINGHTLGDLSWSPDGTRLAFWVIELLGSDPLSNTGNAVLHLLDIASGQLTQFCGFSTTEHTPTTPRVIWSPDGSHVAFGGNVPGDDKGYLLLALDVATGQFTELSDGLFPALGNPDPIAWGLRP